MQGSSTAAQEHYKTAVTSPTLWRVYVYTDRCQGILMRRCFNCFCENVRGN
jgi:hypothetical protein